MESTRSGEGHYLCLSRGSWRDRPALRRVFAETEMCAVIVEVADVGLSEPNSVALAEYDYVIKQLAATSTNPALSHRILPGTAKGGSARLCSHRLDEPDHGGAEDRVPVEDQVLGSHLERKCLA